MESKWAQRLAYFCVAVVIGCLATLAVALTAKCVVWLLF